MCVEGQGKRRERSYDTGHILTRHPAHATWTVDLPTRRTVGLAASSASRISGWWNLLNLEARSMLSNLSLYSSLSSRMTVASVLYWPRLGTYWLRCSPIRLSEERRKDEGQDTHISTELLMLLQEWVCASYCGVRCMACVPADVPEPPTPEVLLLESPFFFLSPLMLIFGSLGSLKVGFSNISANSVGNRCGLQPLYGERTFELANAKIAWEPQPQPKKVMCWELWAVNDE